MCLITIITLIKISEVKHLFKLSFLYLALQELEALLVENFNKLWLKVLVAVPGAPRHRAVRLQVVQHVHLLLRRLHTTNMSGRTWSLCRISWANTSVFCRLTATDFTALISFLLSRFFRILLISVRGRLLLKRISLLQIPADTSDCLHHCTFTTCKKKKRTNKKKKKTEPAARYLCFPHPRWSDKPVSPGCLNLSFYCNTETVQLQKQLISSLHHLCVHLCVYLALAESFSLYRRPELFLSRSSWP